MANLVVKGRCWMSECDDGEWRDRRSEILVAVCDGIFVNWYRVVLVWFTSSSENRSIAPQPGLSMCDDAGVCGNRNVAVKVSQYL